MMNELGDHEISVEITDERDCRKVISVQILPERFDAERELAVKEIAKRASVPGFRKGRVPEEIVKRRFADDIESEAVKRIIPLAYGHVVDKEKLQPIGDPVFSRIKTGGPEPMTFQIDVETAPVIELADHPGVEVPEEPVEVGEADLKDVLENIQERNAAFDEVDRGAVTNDIVVLSYAPVGLDDRPDESKRVDDFPVQLGSGQLFPEFEEALKGRVKGARDRVEISYPPDYQPEHLAGRRILYEFNVKEVREKRLPALDDEFASRMDSSFKTMDDMKRDILERLRKEKAKEARRRREETAVDIMLQRNPFDVPRSMIDRFKQELYAEDARRRESLGLGPEQDEERKTKMEEAFERIAQRNIKRYFLLGRIAEREGFEPTSADVEAELRSLAEENDRPLEDVKRLFARGSENYKNLMNRIRERRIFDAVLGVAPPRGGPVRKESEDEDERQER